MLLCSWSEESKTREDRGWTGWVSLRYLGSDFIYCWHACCVTGVFLCYCMFSCHCKNGLLSLWWSEMSGITWSSCRPTAARVITAVLFSYVSKFWWSWCMAEIGGTMTCFFFTAVSFWGIIWVTGHNSWSMEWMLDLYTESHWKTIHAKFCERRSYPE